MSLPHVLATSFCLDREARRNGQSRIRHLRQAGALAAEVVLHLAVTIGLAAAEKVNVPGCVLVFFLNFSFGKGQCRHDY
jgi:hypothetical protein